MPRLKARCHPSTLWLFPPSRPGSRSAPRDGSFLWLRTKKARATFQGGPSSPLELYLLSITSCDGSAGLSGSPNSRSGAHSRNGGDASAGGANDAGATGDDAGASAPALLRWPIGWRCCVPRPEIRVRPARFRPRRPEREWRLQAPPCTLSSTSLCCLLAVSRTLRCGLHFLAHGGSAAASAAQFRRAERSARPAESEVLAKLREPAQVT